MKIGFIGLGKLGMISAEVMAQKGHEVLGYDSEPRTSDHVTVKDTIAECVQDREIVFVAVPTPHDPSYDGRAPTAHLEPKDFNYDIVKEVLTEANRHMNGDQLLVLISTVLPGTTRREFVQLLTNTRFAYNPYLIAMGTVAWDMVNPEMVMIGTDDGSETGDARLLREFYDTLMENNPRYVIGTWDECECIKVFYNTFISTKLGLVNMIQDVAERQGNINVDVVTDALAKSTQRIMGPAYMKAGLGDGGGCHPRDNIALRYMAQELGLGYDIFDAIMSAREIQAKNLAERVVSLAKEHELAIFINGISFKPGVPYIDGSYALLVDHYIRELGHTTVHVDPLCVEEFDYNPKGVVLLAHPESYKDWQKGSVIVDPWRLYSNDKHIVVHYGNTRQN